MIWQGLGGTQGVIIRCTEDIVAKVTDVDWGDHNTTEYTSMKFIAELAPGIPAPRPHGLVALGPFHVLLMTFVPGITLEKSQNNKISIQEQLEDIFYHLRSLPRDTQEIGEVGGEGAKDLRVEEEGPFKGIMTPQQFCDLQFSAPHRGSKVYVTILRSLPEKDDYLMRRPVFTHGDIRTKNIMVKQDPSTGHYAITGIIDWEFSGFYSPY